MASGSQSAAVRKRLRQDWSVVWANSRLMPQTVLRSATKRPVRYSARWRRWGSLGSRSPKSRRASWTTRGKSTMPAMTAPPQGEVTTAGNLRAVYASTRERLHNAHFAKGQKDDAIEFLENYLPRARLVTELPVRASVKVVSGKPVAPTPAVAPPAPKMQSGSKKKS